MSATPGVDELQRVARRAGLGSGPLTLAAAERRRRRLWLITLTIIVVTCAAGVMVSLADDDGGTSAVWPLWVAVGAAIVFATTDVLITERRLDALTRLLLDEGIALGVEASRASELAALVEAGHAVNGDLDGMAALEVILTRARELVGGDSGSIMLLEDPTRLRVVCAHGSTDEMGAVTELGDGVAGRVAADRRPLRMSGLPERAQFDLLADRRVPMESAMSLPLVHRGELVGVLNVNAPAERRFTDQDLLLMSVLADLAAVAAAGVRDGLRDRSDALLRGTVATLRDLLPRAGPVAGDLRALALVLDSTLPGVEMARLDVGTVARAAAARWVAAGEPVQVRGAEVAFAHADAAALDEVVDRLLANATKHGRAPVEIEVDESPGPDGGTVRLTVLDRGSGIGPEPFEPFTSGGVGLAVVRRLAEAQGATVAARSRAGGGSAVSIVLHGAPDDIGPPAQ
jgi:signal transduction histidine kinase